MATLREQWGDLFNQAGARKNRGRLDPSVFGLRPRFRCAGNETLEEWSLNQKRCSAVLGSQCGLGGSPHEQLAWFPPLALCLKKG
ncbi:MAG: hypothetical protein F6K26_15030 [Moorea sp. SIO2I5]|nr:hypothetical protein [Moorena sp. SIO2I5]